MSIEMVLGFGGVSEGFYFFVAFLGGLRGKIWSNM